MIRNAGGRALDAIRTLSVLQTIGSPGTIVVMHHTGKPLLSSFGASEDSAQVNMGLSDNGI